MSNQISGERKSAFYLGTGLMIAGLLLFASTFVTFAMRFGEFSNFEFHAKSEMFRAFGGIALIALGGIVRMIGTRGLAGSGVVLDPQKARRDLEPYSRMAGGMVSDALDAANITVGGAPGRVIMIKCPSCGKLNEQDSKFCKECGGKL